MKKTLKEIFEPYQIYNDKGELIPLLQTELGKELFGEVNELNKSDVIKSVCDHCGGNNDVKDGMCWDCHEIYDRKG